MFFVFYLILIGMGFGAYLFGALAFCQIVGSIRIRSNFFAIIFWSILTIALCSLVFLFLNKYFWGVIIGLIISLITVLRTPNIY